MTNSIYTEIKKRIKLAESGTVFLTSDFTDLATTTTVRKYLGRQVEEKNIRRIMDGVYEKPVYSNLLNEYIPANPEKVAYAIARSFRWTIAPCGDVALNKLGLSTQVPVVWTDHIESFPGIISRYLLGIEQIVKFHLCLRQPLWLLRH